MPNLTRLLPGLLFMIASAHANDPIRAWIVTTPDNGAIVIAPQVQSQDSLRLRYDLSVRRTGAGTAMSRQSGVTQTECCRPITLTRLRLSISPRDRCEIELRIYQGDRLLREEKITLPATAD